MSDENATPEPIPEKPKLNVRALIFFTILGVSLWFGWNYTKKLIHEGTPTSVETMQKYVVGGWQYSEPLTGKPPYEWMRYEFKNDGKVWIAYARPRDDKWGETKEYSYTIISDKFEDTGDRYFAAKIDGLFYGRAIAMADGTLLLKTEGDTYYRLKRSDTSPFK